MKKLIDIGLIVLLAALVAVFIGLYIYYNFT